MANRFAGLVILIGAAAAPIALLAQDSSAVREARAAYENLDFPAALNAAKRAVRERRLSQGNLATAYEIMAFTYAALDSNRQAVEAFRELIFLDPDREPNVQRVSPRITSLYASALGQVLVVRGLRVDSASFVGGQGGVPIQFKVSRPARVNTRLVGEGLDVLIDSQLVAGVGGFRWTALTAAAEPVPKGHYRLLVTANEGPSNYTGQIAIEVRHAPVDTLPHLTSLPGYSALPETEVPPRDWRPTGVSFLFAGLSSGAAFALSNTELGTRWRRPTIAVSIATLAVGIAMTLRKPDPRPVPANLRYNQLLAEQLAQRNADIARENATRQRQTLLTVVAAAVNRCTGVPFPQQTLELRNCLIGPLLAQEAQTKEIANPMEAWQLEQHFLIGLLHSALVLSPHRVGGCACSWLMPGAARSRKETASASSAPTE